ncbi:MAG: hypothetical protein E2591_29120 [Achromobacter sp.]|uniref:hypothetical protein n=1 Tax=Achromobacter sp. TaxID=134375 RepID=UPI0012CF821F|nr:hypothetical protein [Achromobacter sp.]MPS82137.1 hypothetical protein [Achromobacter sp.]
MTASVYERPEWREPTLVAPARTSGPMLAAFLTTFDPPQADVLIQDLLPEWLGLSNSYADEGADKLRFYAELEDYLKRLHGKFTIISSPGTQEQGGHGWIWRYISRLQVGFQEAAIQHAKLWMFHRAGVAREPETLELLVSSQNLTGSGFRDQIQAGWRCIVPLSSTSTSRQRETWGILPEFLDKLGQACGPRGSDAVRYWQELFQRAVCPKEATFVASVPGRHPATPPQGGTAWGVAALRRLGGSRKRSLSVMVPTIGNWDVDSLKKWVRIAGLDVDALYIAWIESEHPWATRWQMNKPTESALSLGKVNWRQLPAPQSMGKWSSPLSDEHKRGDRRWCHAKLYDIGSNASRQLVCTSANFSRAAWGAPVDGDTIEIDNFEFGVAISADAGLSRQPINQTFTRTTCTTEFEKPVDQPIAWMAAQWNGAVLRIQVRLAKNVVLLNRVRVQVESKTNAEELSAPRMRAGEINLDWSSRDRGIPSRVQLITTMSHACEVVVEDLRPVSFGEWLCDAGTKEEMQDAADQVIEERYDFFDQATRSPSKKKDFSVAPAPSGANYSVTAYEDSRRRFAAIDHWIDVLGTSCAPMRRYVLADGQRIAERWTSTAQTNHRPEIALSAKLAAEELLNRLRVEHREEK